MSAHENFVRADFDLDDTEVRLIEDEFGEGVLRGRLVTLSKGYDDALCVDLEVDEEVAVMAAIRLAGLPSHVEKEALKYSSLKGLASFLNSKAETRSPSVRRGPGRRYSR